MVGIEPLGRAHHDGVSPVSAYNGTLGAHHGTVVTHNRAAHNHTPIRRCRVLIASPDGPALDIRLFDSDGPHLTLD